MKKIFLINLMLVFACLAFAQVDEEVAQEEYTQQDDYRQDEIKTLFQKGKRGAVGGYGGLSMLYSQIDNRDAFSFGARAGVVLGHMMTIGFCGTGFFNDAQYYNGLTEKASIAGGYGGLFFEPIIFPRFPVHVSVPVAIGVGGVAFSRMYDYDDYDDFYPEESDAYIVIEPGIELELNITKFFRFSVGGYYRYTTDVDLVIGTEKAPTNLLRGFSGGINFKFGKF
ncbi:MAG: hypothetical protein JXR41_15820 [Bacteroidales bacterium]|nr:hypothetical protein [Bacteroidales bacterium]MBN2764563.1 hypothetical protein [Bacteroidales bacterium]